MDVIDSVGSVAFHPYNPTLLSVAGSRHYEDLDAKMGLLSSPGDCDDDSDSDASTSNDDRVVPTRLRERLHPTTTDSSIKLWDFSIKQLS